MDLYATFSAWVATYCRPTEPVLVAASGGLDSMVLADLFHRLKQPLALAHMNFQLRGDASDQDEAFVQAWAQARAVEVISTRVDTKKYAREQGVSVQEAARALRYQWFEELAVQKGFVWIATAHHLNDSFETVLWNWLQGAALEDLRGIPSQRHRIIRPLLAATRADIHAYAVARGIEWREDQSNSSLDYPRNYLRHEVIPRLRNLNPSLERTWQRAWVRQRDELDLLQELATAWQAKYVTREPQRWRVTRAGLAQKGGVTFLFRVLRSLGFTIDQCEDMVKAREGQPGVLFFSPTHVATLDRIDLIVEPRVEAMAPQTIHRPGRYEAGVWALDIAAEDPGLLSTDPSVAQIDAHRLEWPLTWRAWQPGDRFTPLGMSQSKKVSDFLVDQKVSRLDKVHQTVVESKGEIIWLAGLRIADPYKVTPATTHVLRLKIKVRAAF